MALLNRHPNARQPERLSANHKLLYQYIRTRGPLARADLVRISDLTFPSISRMVAELLEGGLVQETTQRRGGMGKPPTELMLIPEAARSLGVVLDDNRAVAVVIDAIGTILERTEVEASPADPLESVKAVLQRLETPATKLLGVGLTRRGGPLEASEREALEGSLGLDVASESRAGAGVLRERYFGAAQTLDSFVYLSVGEGVSSAALLGHRLLAPEGQLAGLAEVLGAGLEASDAAWASNLPVLCTALLCAEQLLAPEALIVGGDVSDAQLDELSAALQERRGDASTPTPLLKGFAGSDERALAAATLPLYRHFAVTTQARPQA